MTTNAPTPAQLDAWRKLAEEATPGPWHGDTDRGEVKYAVLGANDTLVLQVDHKNGESGFVGDNSENDEAFTLAARTAVPALLAEVERLTAELDNMRYYEDERRKERDHYKDALRKAMTR